MGTARSQTERPRVAARSVREGRCSFSELTTTCGSPTPIGFQVAPESAELYTAISLPRYRKLGISGSTTRSFAGTLGRLPLMSVQETPAFVVLKTWPSVLPSVKPEKMAYAMEALVGSTTTCDTYRFGKPAEILVHVADVPAVALFVVDTLPSLAPV